MIPASFDYEVADSPAHAISLLAEHGEDAKLLAGGHSLLPMMKVRLAQPAVLIDIARVGRAVRHQARRRRGGDRGDDPARRARRVVAAAGRGADPGLRGRAGRRPADQAPRHHRRLARARGPVRRPADDAARARRLGRDQRAVRACAWWASTTSSSGRSSRRCQPDELLTAVRVPRGGSVRWGYQKFVRRANDWAIVGVAVYDGRVALASMGGTPLRATATEEALRSGASIDEAAAAGGGGHLSRVRLPRRRGLPRAPRARSDQARTRRQDRLTPLPCARQAARP